MPTQPLDFAGLLLLANGHSAFQLLYSAMELDLFSKLSREPRMTQARIASAVGLAPQPARILLMGLTSLGLLVKSDDAYVNTEIAEAFLVRGKPACAASYLEFQKHIVNKGVAELTTALRENRNAGLEHFPGAGKTLYERLASDGALEKIFHDSMSRISGLADDELGREANLRGAKRLLDLGGGDGTNTIRLVRNNPGLTATILDLPSVCEVAAKKVAAAGLADRIRTLGGNFLSDPVPPGADAIIIAHILTIWSPERNTALLKKCYEALPPGGRLMTFNMISDDDETGPTVNALASLYFQSLATGEGMLYCEKDYRAWFRDAGFDDVTVRKLPHHHGLFTAIKAAA